MKKNLFLVLVGGLILLLGAAPASALIMFDETALGTSNPSITDNGLTVNFSGGVYTGDGWTPGNAYLASGFDPSGNHDTFIGATADGFLFETVSFDILAELFLPPETTFNVAAYSGGSVVAASSMTASDWSYHSMNVSFATGFDSLVIWDDLDSNGLGEFFHIDNFAFTQYVDDGGGPAPVPEPATMLLLATGLSGMAFVRRKKLIK